MKNTYYLVSTAISFGMYLMLLVYSLIEKTFIPSFFLDLLPLIVFCSLFFGSVAKNLFEVQKDKIWIFAVIFLAVMLFYNQSHQKEKKADPLPATRAIPSAVTNKASPPTEADWYEIFEGLYARPTAEYTECYFYGNGTDYCAGETVQYYTLADQAIVYEQASLRKTTTLPIFAGRETAVKIPADAINIHWRFIDTDPNN